MIHLCTCTGGSSASTISSSKRRGGSGTISCKNCGGRPAIDGKNPSTCLLSTVLELTSLINSDFTWTKVSKGCRSASRRPRRLNTIGIVSKDSKGLEMPVSESEKLGVSVLGCHFSEKDEHIPIKKRRVLFRASSPPRNTPNPSLKSPKASTHGLQIIPNPNPNTTFPPVESGISQRGSSDDKELVKKVIKEDGEDDDFSGISILAAAACSNSLGAEADLDPCEDNLTKNPQVLNTVEVEENNLKSDDIRKEESDSHTSTKDHSSPDKKLTLDNSSPNESTLDDIPFSQQAPLESANQEASKSSARDVRLNWDLNTVMDAWEEPFVSDHGISAHDNVPFVEEKDNNCIKDVSVDCELGNGRECGTATKTTSNQILPVVELRSLAHENEELKLGNHKPDGYVKIEPLSHEVDSVQDDVVKELEPLHSKQINGGNDSIPVTRTLTLENPTHVVFSKWVNLGGQRPGGLGCTEAVDTKLSMDCSVPPGFDHFRAAKEKEKENVGFSSAIVGVGNNSNFPTTCTTQTTTTVTSRSEYDKDDLSLTTAASLENGADQSGVTSNNKVDDEVKVKMELTSDVVAMEDLVSKEENDLHQETDNGGLTHSEILVVHSSVVVAEEDPPAVISPMHDNTEEPMETGFGYDNSQSDNRALSGIDKLEEVSVGYDSQYEDGELRESSINAWKGYEENGNGEENEYDDMDNMGDGYNLCIADTQETSSQCGEEGSSRIKFSDVGSGGEADLISSVLVPEKLHSSDEVSGSGPNEIISGGQDNNNERQDVVQQHAASQSDEWKMNVSGWDLLPENQRISSNNSFSKTRNLSSRKIFYREQKDGFEMEDPEAKAEGSRFYRKEPLRGPSTRDMFVNNNNRGRFRMQGCSSKAADGLSSRPERESGALRSFGRGRYSPRRASGRGGGGMWNRSPERGRDLKRLPSPSYQGQPFLRSMLEDAGSVDNEGNMDPSDTGRPITSSSYVTRRPFRSRSPMNREENDFHARLGLRPTAETSHDRFVNMGRGRGRGRSVRYGSRLEGAGPRGRYLGPGNEECDEFVTEYSHPYPRRRRCFSPIERRGNHSYNDSRSPPPSSRPRTRSPIAANTGFRRRSRSPNFRPDATRMRRPRSPNYMRGGFEADHATNEYNPGPRNNNNSSPPSSRWVNYKERPAIFDRRSPPPGRTDPPQGERFSFYDSSRKPKQNEYYRSGHPGRFSDLNEGGRGRPRYSEGDRPNNGYRRGGFVRRYNMEGGPPAKRFQYEDEDGFGRGFDARDKHALELHARGNPSKPCSNNGGTDSRFRDFPRRPREDKEMVGGGEFKRRSREGKDTTTTTTNEREPKEDNEHIVDEFQRRPWMMKDQSTTTTTTTTTNPDSMPNEAVKDGDKTNVWL